MAYSLYRSLIGFTLGLNAHSLALLAVLCGILGIFITAILPLSLEAAVECSFPIPEALSGGIIMISTWCFECLMSLDICATVWNYIYCRAQRLE